jgi:hypothetical protein
MVIPLSVKSSIICLLRNVPSATPSAHWSQNNPHDFLPTITPFTILGCLVIIGLPPEYWPLSYFLNVFLPSDSFISNSTVTFEPQNDKIPHR